MHQLCLTLREKSRPEEGERERQRLRKRGTLKEEQKEIEIVIDR